MKLMEGFIRDEIYIDFGSEPLFGQDQLYDSFPVVFPTVDFALMDTNGLCRIADRIRKDAGYVPLYPLDEYAQEQTDQDGWYAFYVGINGCSKTRMNSCIEFWVGNSQSPDNEEIYTIDLSLDEQLYLYQRLDCQCRKYLGKTCMELLKDAEKLMEEDPHYYGPCPKSIAAEETT